MQISRRNVLGFGAAGALAFGGLTKAFAVETHRASYYNEVEGYGPLREDKARIVDLPSGFSYRIISQAGETMDDGLLVPHVFDGMGCFSGRGDEIILVRNHELLPEHRDFGSLGMNGRLIERLDKTKVYDFENSGLPLGGGTTTVVYDLKKNKVIRQHQSLIGTTTNCAGGTTPWGSWLSCEESVLRKGQGVGKDHGYVFEVPSNSRGLIDPLPIRAMGRFKHEAACIDPRTGIVYMTEDVEDGLFYRYLPDDRSDLKKGGRLEAMGLKAHPEGCDTSNRKDALWRTGERFEVVWIPLDDVENPNDDLRCRGFKAGAAKVCRGEGIHFGTNEIFICATAGGAVGSGQILRYTPSPHEGQADEKDRPGSLSLFLESINEKVFDYGDNLTVSPWDICLFAKIATRIPCKTICGSLPRKARWRRLPEMSSKVMGSGRAPASHLTVRRFLLTYSGLVLRSPSRARGPASKHVPPHSLQSFNRCTRAKTREAPVITERHMSASNPSLCVTL